MRKINLKTLYVLLGISILDICLGVYERLVPTRGYIYMLQTTMFAPWGEVPAGTTALNMTNSYSMITVNTNTGTAFGFFFIIIIVAFAFVAAVIIAALQGDNTEEQK